MEKVINIDSYDDYKKFLNKLIIYKSFIYCKTKFIIKNNIDDDNIDLICNALNIKNRKRRITYIYDKSCELIDKKVDNKNICGFKNNKCYSQRKSNSKYCNGCCRKCLYQTNKGCSTSNLTCKIFNCTEVTKRYDVLTYDDLNLLKLLSIKNRYLIKIDYFSTRIDVLKDLYSYSFIYSGIRITYRFIRNLIILHKRKKGM